MPKPSQSGTPAVTGGPAGKLVQARVELRALRTSCWTGSAREGRTLTTKYAEGTKEAFVPYTRRAIKLSEGLADVKKARQHIAVVVQSVSDVMTMHARCKDVLAFFLNLSWTL